MRFRRAGRRLAASLAAWFYSLTVLGKIGVSVACFHLFLLLVLSIDHLASSSQKEKRPLAIRTHHLQAPPPPVQKPKLASLPVNPLHSDRVKASSSVKQPSAKPAKKTEKKEPIAKAPPPPKPKAPPEIQLPSYLEKSQVEIATEAPSASSSFGPHLAALLQEQLQLPEIGEVEVRIVLEAPGTIVSIEILDARSSKNAEWLKKQLPSLTVPCFNDFSIADARLEFTVTFRNVEKI